MNRRLRARHRWLTTVLAIAVPCALAAAIVVRPEIPTMSALPTVSDETWRDHEPVKTDVIRIDGTHVEVRLLVGPRPGDRFAVELRPRSGEAIRGADVLVYWTDVSVLDGLPPSARHVGTLAGPHARRFELPQAAAERAGRLVFFSLGQQRLAEGDWPLPALESLR